MVSKVYVIGVGMGNPDTLTQAACAALSKSDLIIGSERLLDGLDGFAGSKCALVRSADIASTLRSSQARVASVVMSGDVGLYSGATRLYELLDGMDVEVIPGISTVSYLCAKLRMPWQDVYLASVHGRACDVEGIVQTHARSFFLTGGADGVRDVCARLVERGLGYVRVTVGERLSYPDERITTGTAESLMEGAFDSLAAVLVENAHPLQQETAAPHLPDSAFERGEVPMTKEEVRELAVCKLRVRPSDTVWDVGSGTGSVTVELARAACRGQVFAIEKNPEAIRLIRRNSEAFGLTNVRTVEGVAPCALETLPPADRVFVGGSSGSLEEILQRALEANPAVRLCVTAVTLETFSEWLRLVKDLGLVDADVIQVSVAKACAVGEHHLMVAANPVYVLCADGPGTAKAGDSR